SPLDLLSFPTRRSSDLVGLGQTARRLDADLLLLASALVLGLDVDDAVGVDVERDLDLRHATRRRWQSDQVELTEHLVVGRHLARSEEHTSELQSRENLV